MNKDKNETNNSKGNRQSKGRMSKQNEDANKKPQSLQIPISNYLTSTIVMKDGKETVRLSDFSNVFLIELNKQAFYQGKEAITRAKSKFEFCILSTISLLQSKRPRDKKTLQKINIDLFNNNFKPCFTQSANYSLLSSLFDINKSFLSKGQP